MNSSLQFILRVHERFEALWPGRLESVMSLSGSEAHSPCMERLALVTKHGERCLTEGPLKGFEKILLARPVELVSYDRETGQT